MSNHNPDEPAKRLGRRARQLSLTLEEKLVGLHTLQHFINTHPRPVRPARLVRHYRWWSWRPITMMAVAIIVVSISAAGAAQRALPGDVLYPVKITITEPVTVWLAPDPSVKAKLAIAQAKARLQEAELLAAKGALDPVLQQTLEESFQDRTEKAKAYLAELKAVKKSREEVELSTELSKTLSGYQKLSAKSKQPSPATTTKVLTKPQPLQTNKETKKSATTKIPKVNVIPAVRHLASPSLMPPATATPPAATTTPPVVPPTVFEQIKAELSQPIKSQLPAPTPVVIINNKEKESETKAEIKTGVKVIPNNNNEKSTKLSR
jgi:hypothetical protein